MTGQTKFEWYRADLVRPTLEWVCRETIDFALFTFTKCEIEKSRLVIRPGGLRGGRSSCKRWVVVQDPAGLFILSGLPFGGRRGQREAELLHEILIVEVDPFLGKLALSIMRDAATGNRYGLPRGG